MCSSCDSSSENQSAPDTASRAQTIIMLLMTKFDKVRKIESSSFLFWTIRFRQFSSADPLDDIDIVDEIIPRPTFINKNIYL
jgi:hypothetical protein